MMKQEYIEIIKELSKCFGIEQSLSQTDGENKLEYEKQLVEQKEQVKVLYNKLKIKGNNKGFIEFLDDEYGNESDLYLLLVNYLNMIVKDVQFEIKYEQKHLEEGMKRDDNLFLLLSLDFQIRAYAFRENVKIDFEKQWNVNKYLGSRLKEELSYNVMRVPLSERNKDLVVVVTSQMLSLNHAPTYFVWEYCYVLKKKLKKEVLILNIAMDLDAKKLT